jgi:hypothetical protein
MIPNANTPQGKAMGDQISQYVLAHAKELGVDYTIWQHGQHNPDGSFQMYPDRGSPTQNHMDHVHIHTVRGGPSGGGIPDGSTGFAASSGLGGSGMGGMGGSSKMPAGTDSDPIFTAQSTSSAAGGGDKGDSNAQQLGQGLLGGLAQSVGLDGSVFHTFGGSSNPMGFGATKMASSLLNWGMGMMAPGQGAAVSANGMPVAPGSTHPGAGQTTNIFNGQTGGFNLTQNGTQGNGVPEFKGAANAAAGRGVALAAPLPG